MKALKDSKWEVSIDDNTKYGSEKPFCWDAYISKNKKENLLYLQCFADFKTLSGAKKNWETFAELNGIQNWKYVK